MKNILQKLRPYVPQLFLVGILLLAVYLRLYRISEYMTFLGDEGRDMLVVTHMIVDHKWTLLGPTASVGGFFLGPIYYYFMLPFVWLFRLDPSGAAVMVALFGIATIYLVYRTGRDMFDAWVGLVAAALYAISPLIIAYSRSSWNPNLVPFFSMLVIYFSWRSIVRSEPKLLFWIGVALGIGLQLHYLFLFLFPVVALWFLLRGRKAELLRYYGLGIVGFLVGYGPFLAFEVRHGFPNTISIFRFLMEGKDTGFVFMKFLGTIGDVTYRLFGRLLYRLPPPEQWINLAQTKQLVWDIGIKVTIWSSLGLIGSYIAKKLQPPGKNQKAWDTGIIMLTIWFVVPILLFGFYKKAIYDYYFGILFPFPILCIALLARAVGELRIGKWISIAGLAALVWFNWQGRPFVAPPNNQLGQAKLIARAALDKTGGKSFNFALLANFNSDHAYRYFFEIWKSAPVTIENVANDPERKTVTDQLIIICELPECKPLGHPLWEIAGFGRAEISGQWQVSFVKIFRLVHYTGEQKK